MGTALVQGHKRPCGKDVRAARGHVLQMLSGRHVRTTSRGGGRLCVTVRWAISSLLHRVSPHGGSLFSMTTVSEVREQHWVGLARLSVFTGVPVDVRNMLCFLNTPKLRRTPKRTSFLYPLERWILLVAGGRAWSSVCRADFLGRPLPGGSCWLVTARASWTFAFRFYSITRQQTRSARTSQQGLLFQDVASQSGA